MRVAKNGIAPAEPDATLDYDGEALPARAGESVAAALVAAGRYECRTTRAGGARGVFCGMGVCGECSVTLDGRGSKLSCLEKVTDLHALQRNPAARELEERELDAAPESVELADVLVIGAGPAGLSAACAAAATGARVLVVDERTSPGGQYFKQPAASLPVDEGALDAQYRAGRRLIGEFAASGARFLGGVRVWGHTSPFELFGASAGERHVLRARALVLATGAFEAAAPFPGWTLPGVMTTGAAQTLLRSYLVAPGERVLVAGNGPLNLQVAAELVEAGVDVVAVAEAGRLWRPQNLAAFVAMGAAAPRYARQGLGYLATLVRARVPLLAGATVVEARGARTVEEAVVAPIDSEGRPQRARARRFGVDAVCLGLGFVPSSELARGLGCRAGVERASGALVIERTASGRTSVPGVWVAGDGGAVRGAQVAQAMGYLAGLDAAAFAGHRGDGARDADRRRREQALRRHDRFQEALWRLYRAPRLLDKLADEETVVCRCEEVTLGELRRAAAPFLDAAGSLKRVTRAGMGRCQGRYCSPVLVELAARASGVAAGPFSGFAPQAPCLPVAVGAMAGDDPC